MNFLHMMRSPISKDSNLSEVFEYHLVYLFEQQFQVHLYRIPITTENEIEHAMSVNSQQFEK